MACQNYKERVVYPCGALQATPEQFAELIMGDLGVNLTLDFEVGGKLITESGVVIYRKSETRYNLWGSADKIVLNKPFDEKLPVDLSDLLDDIIESHLGTVTLLM